MNPENVLRVPDKVELGEKRRQIAARLAIPLWRWSAVRDGEFRKHLRRIADQLDAARAVDATRARLVSLADSDPNKLDLDSALSLSTRLGEMLFELEDEAAPGRGPDRKLAPPIRHVEDKPTAPLQRGSFSF